MKVIIAGSRSILSFDEVDIAIRDSGFDVTEVVSGCANGVDSVGEVWAMKHDIPVKEFPADWSIGRWVGFNRNKQMANYADALVAVWDGESPGTRQMIRYAQSKGLKVFVRTVSPLYML